MKIFEEKLNTIGPETKLHAENSQGRSECDKFKQLWSFQIFLGKS